MDRILELFLLPIHTYRFYRFTKNRGLKFPKRVVFAIRYVRDGFLVFVLKKSVFPVWLEPCLTDWEPLNDIDFSSPPDIN